MTLATLLKSAREKQGLSLRQVEAETNIPCSLICQIETKKIKNPSFFTVRKLAIFYRISMFDILNIKS